jgi:hypothetical protein
MKILRVGFAVLAAALLLLAYGGSTPQAFHSGGVAECTGCHSMHSPAPGGSYLLIGTDQSSTCLLCHENATDTGPNGYHISTAGTMAGTALPLQRTPGGDFGWLKKTYTYTYGTPAVTYTEDGATHGHNVVAVDKNYVVDPVNSTAPGGTFPASQLACNSCHDPHGQYRRLPNGTVSLTGGAIYASGSYYNGTDVTANEPKTFSGSTETLAVGVYRLLAGAGYTKGGVTFNGVPAAKVPSTYNRTEVATQTRAAYGHATSGGHESWGDWCATCHPAMHSSGSGSVHPIDQNLGSVLANNYNTYVKSGDLTGSSTNSYWSLVPFVQNTADYAGGLAPNAVNSGTTGYTGPTSTDQVTCLSCHRAHASGMMYGLRFDVEYEFMTKEGQYIGSDNPAVTGSRAPAQHRGRLNADWQAAYYDRPASQFSAYQRVLCNKCHVQD